MDVALTVARCVVPRVLFKDSTRMAHVFLEAEEKQMIRKQVKTLITI